MIFFFTFIESLKVVLINVIAVLLMSPKLAIPGVFKITSVKDVTISVHSVTNKASSRDSSYTVHV